MAKKKRGRPPQPAVAQLTQAMKARRMLEKELATPAATVDQAIAAVARQLKISARTVKRRLSLLNKDAGLKAELDEWFSHVIIDAGEY